MICKLCDKPFEPNSKNHNTYCSTKCASTSRKILDSYVSNRIATCLAPRGQILKVLKNYNIPTFGVSFDDRGNARRFGANTFDS